MAKEHIVSKMSIMGHPIHPMLIHFPVAALLGLIATDLAYVVLEDFFWARASFWLAGIGMAGGWISGTAGLIDLVFVQQIRRLVIAWCHALLAVMLLSLATLNWLLRMGDNPEILIMPWGLYLSLLTGLLIGLTSLMGGELVYDHAVGVSPERMAERRKKAGLRAVRGASFRIWLTRAPAWQARPKALRLPKHRLPESTADSRGAEISRGRPPL